MCWPSQAQSLAALEADHRGGAQERQRGAGGVVDLGGQRRAEEAVAEGEGRGLEVVPAGRAPRGRWRASRATAVAYQLRQLGVGLSGIGASGCCGRPSRCRPRGKLQEMTKRTLAALAGGHGDAGGERAVLGLQAHVARGARRVVVPLRAAGRGGRTPSRRRRGCRTTGRGSGGRCARRPSASVAMVRSPRSVGLQVGVGRGEVQARRCRPPARSVCSPLLAP